MTKETTLKVAVFAGVVVIMVLLGVYFSSLNPARSRGTVTDKPGTVTNTSSSSTNGVTGKPANTDRPPKTGTTARVVVVRNPKLKDGDTFIATQLQKTVNVALRTLFQTETGAEALAKIVTPNDKVGLKIQCYRGEPGNVTHPELVDAVIYFLREDKVPENNLVVWDDEQADMEKAGYTINRSERGVRYLASRYKKPRDQGIEMIMGFEEPEITAGKVKTRLASIPDKFTSVTISMPVLKTHRVKDKMWINGALLNMYGAIEWTEKNSESLYGNECDPSAADVYSIPQIRNRTRLIICDALTPLYNGGPMDDPKYHTEYNGIIVGFDPVAVDAVGQSILQKIRREKLGNNAPEVKTKYLDTAAGAKYKLGTADLGLIEIIERDLE